MALTPHQLLLKYFNYSSFRPGQLDIINSIVKGHDSLAIMPTGGGKSLCYQIPGLMLDGLTIVISPLISLMKDQVDQLKKRGIAATFMNSSVKKEEIKLRIEKINQGKIKFCYLAPERLFNTEFIHALNQQSIPLIVIDEAHCISEWGHDFRPSYLLINKFISKLTIRPTIAAFTATATKKVEEDIIYSLQLLKVQTFNQGFYRSNLHFSVINCTSNYQKEVWLFRLLKIHQGKSGIIYTSTREGTLYLTQLLKHFNYQAQAYHGGLNQQLRAEIQENFIQNRIPIIVATNAFGMGIDKPDVRFVIHFHLPGSIENYYQEAGRAGRDKLAAKCYLLFCPRDIGIIHNLIQPQNNDKNKQQVIKQQQLQAMVNYTQTKQCRIKFLINYFGGSSKKIECKQCDHCHHLDLINKTEVRFLKKLHIFDHQADAPSYHQLQQLALHQPLSIADILKLPGWGKGMTDRWGDQILPIFQQPSNHFD